MREASGHIRHVPAQQPKLRELFFRAAPPDDGMADAEEMMRSTVQHWEVFEPNTQYPILFQTSHFVPWAVQRLRLNMRDMHSTRNAFHAKASLYEACVYEHMLDNAHSATALDADGCTDLQEAIEAIKTHSAHMCDASVLDTVRKTIDDAFRRSV